MAEPSHTDPVDQTRRRLLLAGAYAAPAVLTSLLVGEQAFAQGGCPPYVNRCNPFFNCAPGRCGPLRNPCNPAGSG